MLAHSAGDGMVGSAHSSGSCNLRLANSNSDHSKMKMMTKKTHLGSFSGILLCLLGLQVHHLRL